MKKMIELQNVTKEFREEAVLKDVTLELYDNKIYGFTGRNGSGKSVLFKLISGYMRPSKGTVIVDGKVLGSDCDFPEEMGALIETPGFLRYESGFANLNYLAKIQNIIGREEVEHAMEMVGLDPKSKKHVGKYSLGMKQRLGIAQTLMERPKIVILDEPMNALDDAGVEIIRKLILDYKGKDRVILLASHNKEDIDVLCDHVYEIETGILKNIR